MSDYRVSPLPEGWGVHDPNFKFDLSGSDKRPRWSGAQVGFLLHFARLRDPRRPLSEIADEIL